MAGIIVFILGIIFVLFDVSVLPIFAKGFIFFDFTLFYINSLVPRFKENSFLFLVILAIFKSFFLLKTDIPQLFILYTLSVLVIFVLVRTLSIESIFLELIISVFFLFVEIKLLRGYSVMQIISTLLIHLIVWIFLINILQGLFKKLKMNLKSGQRFNE